MILNFKYGLQNPLGWDDDCEREITLQDALWNRLVALEATYRERVEDTIRQDQAYRAAADEILGVTNELETALAERRAQRKAARSKLATPVLDEQISELSKQRRELWAKAKPLRTAAFKFYRDELKVLSDERYASFTKARQESGLWWANYNAVLGSFDATLRRIEPWQTPRALGNEGRLSGRLSVQLQGGCPGPSFIAGSRNEARIDLRGGEWHRRGTYNWRPRYGHMVATVHAEGRGTRKLVRWPMVMHRPLPDGAVVKSLVITRRRPVPTSPLWKWEATLACEIPEPKASTTPLSCGIDIGWRKVEAGLRIATIADTATGLDHLVLPTALLERRARIAVLQGQVELEAREKGMAKTDHYDWRRLTLEVARWNRRRRDLYRVAAAELVRRCHLIGIDASGIASMAKDRRLPPETRRMRTWAAPAEFAAYVKDAARKAGATVRQVEGASTLVCHRCGHKNVASEADRQALVWRCAGCRGIWDQDENAAKNCLAAVLETSAAITVKTAAERKRPPRMNRKKKPPEIEKEAAQ